MLCCEHVRHRSVSVVIWRGSDFLRERLVCEGKRREHCRSSSPIVRIDDMPIPRKHRDLTSHRPSFIASSFQDLEHGGGKVLVLFLLGDLLAWVLKFAKALERRPQLQPKARKSKIQFSGLDAQETRSPQAEIVVDEAVV